jgi:hypothetical protein
LGTVHDNEMLVAPAVALNTGADGATGGATGVDQSSGPSTLAPTAFTAASRYTYNTPLVRPVSV